MGLVVSLKGDYGWTAETTARMTAVYPHIVHDKGRKCAAGKRRRDAREGHAPDTQREQQPSPPSHGTGGEKVEAHPSVPSDRNPDIRGSTEMAAAKAAGETVDDELTDTETIVDPVFRATQRRLAAKIELERATVEHDEAAADEHQSGEARKRMIDANVRLQVAQGELSIKNEILTKAWVDSGRPGLPYVLTEQDEDVHDEADGREVHDAPRPDDDLEADLLQDAAGRSLVDKMSAGCALA